MDADVTTVAKIVPASVLENGRPFLSLALGHGDDVELDCRLR